MARPLILSNRLQSMLDAGERFGQTVADDRQLQLQNRRQATLDAQGTQRHEQDMKFGGLKLSAAEREQKNALELDAWRNELAQADAQPEDEATTALKDRLRAKMFTASGTPTVAKDLAGKREADAFQKLTLSAEEKRKQGKYESELANDKTQREYYGSLSGKAQADAMRPKPSDIPIDVKSEVTALAHKNAGKVSIANQIGSYLDQFKKAKTEDDKVRIGGQMLKVLNSPEGADAIGVEEAKRLGDALEYNILDVGAGLGMKPGKLVGRDLKGFERQVQATYDAIKGSIDQNRSEVGRLMGRQEPQAAPSQAPTQNGIATVSSDADYDALPSGAVFIDPKGIKRRKP